MWIQENTSHFDADLTPFILKLTRSELHSSDVGT
jgi:hypothetical protein